MTKCHDVISKLKGQSKVLSPQGHTASEELTQLTSPLGFGWDAAFHIVLT